MRVSEVYGGAFLTGTELKGQTIRVTIAGVSVQAIGEANEEKLVVDFVGAKKSLILNKTNASACSGAFGDETDAWVGREVELFTMPVAYGGKTFDGIRIRTVEQSPPEPELAAVANDDCPF